MNRPLSKFRPLGIFSEGIGQRRNQDRIWATHSIRVQKPNAGVTKPTEGKFIREFGGMGKITETADGLLGDYEEINERASMMGMMGAKSQVAVQYDIIPETKTNDPSEGVGITLDFYVSEGFEEDSYGITTTDLTEQSEYYIDQLEKAYPNADVLNGGEKVTCNRPRSEDKDRLIYYTST